MHINKNKDYSRTYSKWLLIGMSRTSYHLVDVDFTITPDKAMIIAQVNACDIHRRIKVDVIFALMDDQNGR